MPNFTTTANTPATAAEIFAAVKVVAAALGVTLSTVTGLVDIEPDGAAAQAVQAAILAA